MPSASASVIADHSHSTGRTDSRTGLRGLCAVRSVWETRPANASASAAARTRDWLTGPPRRARCGGQSGGSGWVGHVLLGLGLGHGASLGGGGCSGGRGRGCFLLGRGGMGWDAGTGREEYLCLCPGRGRGFGFAVCGVQWCGVEWRTGRQKERNCSYERLRRASERVIGREDVCGPSASASGGRMGIGYMGAGDVCWIKSVDRVVLVDGTGNAPIIPRNILDRVIRHGWRICSWVFAPPRGRVK